MIRVQVTTKDRSSSASRIDLVAQADDHQPVDEATLVELLKQIQQLGARNGPQLTWRVSATPWGTYRGEGRPLDQVLVEAETLVKEHDQAAGHRGRPSSTHRTSPAAAAAGDKEKKGG